MCTVLFRYLCYFGIHLFLYSVYFWVVDAKFWRALITYLLLLRAVLQVNGGGRERGERGERRRVYIPVETQVRTQFLTYILRFGLLPAYF
jgi:hypothetical protein